jgi:HlyD family secretion protein
MLFSKYVLPATAAAGLCFAVFTIARASQPVAVAQPVAAPASAPFVRFIAGAGIVEPSSKCVAIGAPLSRCVASVLVDVGQEVEAGDALFVLEGRDLEAERVVRRSALAAAEAKLGRQHALPRVEDLPVARARVAEGEALLADARVRLELAESVADRRALSLEEVERRRHETAAAAARCDEARASLALLEAGAWAADLEVARAELASAAAQLQAIEIEIERLIVRAPIRGTLLQVNVRAGEFAPAGALDTPLVLMGSVDELHVRVDIDENDAWRFREGVAATASVRGNRDIGTALRFAYVEPYVVPKRSLTGDASERVDTRVMQVIFAFAPGSLPIHVGQQMDVFIEVEPEHARVGNADVAFEGSAGQ